MLWSQFECDYTTPKKNYFFFKLDEVEPKYEFLKRFGCGYFWGRYIFSMSKKLNKKYFFSSVPQLL